MRTVLLSLALTALFAVAGYAQDAGVVTLNQVTPAAIGEIADGSRPLSQLALTYSYVNQWGVNEVWQLQGTTLRYREAVQTIQWPDPPHGYRSLLPADGMQVTLPLSNSIKYYEAHLSPNDVRALVAQLAGLPQTPARAGCGENHWMVELEIAGLKTQKFDVNAPGNPELLALLRPIQQAFGSVQGSMTTITKADWEAAYKVIVEQPATLTL